MPDSQFTQLTALSCLRPPPLLVLLVTAACVATGQGLAAHGLSLQGQGCSRGHFLKGAVLQHQHLRPVLDKVSFLLRAQLEPLAPHAQAAPEREREALEVAVWVAEGTSPAWLLVF